jgi:hypothetical protein
MNKKELTIDFDLYRRELRHEKNCGWDDGSKYIIKGLLKIIANEEYGDEFAREVFDLYDGIVPEDLRRIVAVLSVGNNAIREQISKELEEENGE